MCRHNEVEGFIYASSSSVYGSNKNIPFSIKDRVDERTSWDGAILIAIGVVVLIAGPLAKIAAWGAIGYGAWTLWKKEK